MSWHMSDVDNMDCPRMIFNQMALNFQVMSNFFQVYFVRVNSIVWLLACTSLELNHIGLYAPQLAFHYFRLSTVIISLKSDMHM